MGWQQPAWRGAVHFVGAAEGCDFLIFQRQKIAAFVPRQLLRVTWLLDPDLVTSVVLGQVQAFVRRGDQLA